MSSVPVIKRSVLVNGVSAEVGPDVLKEFFGNVGETTSVSSLSYDPVSNTRQYQVTFASPDSLPSALHLSGLMLINKIITIVPADPTAPLPVQQQQQQQQPPSEFGSAAVNSNGGLQGEVALLPPQGPVIPGIVMQSMMSMGPVVPDNNGIEYVDGHRVAVFLAPGHIVAEKNKALSGSSNSSSGEPGKEKSAVAMNPDAALIAEKREQVAKTVYVGNVKRSVSAEQLSAFFSGCGMVTYVCFRGDEIPGPVHYGFVEFDSVEAAQKAMSVSGAFLEGFPIKVSSAKNPIVRPSPSVSETNKRKEERAKFESIAYSISKRVLGGKASAEEPTDAVTKAPEKDKEAKKPSDEKNKKKDDEKDKKEKHRERSQSKHHRSHRHHHRRHHRSHRRGKDSGSSSSSSSSSSSPESKSKSPERHKSKSK